MDAIEINLRKHASHWSRIGAGDACSGEITSYRIPGRESGQEILLRNTGLTKRPWQYLVYENGEELCCNRNFSAAEDALVAAYKWLDMPSGMRLTLRSYMGSGNHHFIAVDCLCSNVDVVIAEFHPNDWRFRVVINGVHVDWSAPCLSPQDALQAYQSSVTN